MKKIAIYIFIGIISILLLSGWTDWKKLGLKGKIVYVGTFDKIHILDLATGKDNKLGEKGMFPILSPDGNKIVFRSYTGIAGLTIKDIATKEKEGVDKGTCTPISWSPDMIKLVYWTNKLGEEENYMGAVIFDLKDKKKYYMNTDSISWSPDGKRAVCSATTQTHEYKTIFWGPTGQRDLKTIEDEMIIIRDEESVISISIKNPYLDEEREIYNAESKKFSEEADNLIFKIRNSEIDKYALIEKNDENDFMQLDVIDTRWKNGSHKEYRRKNTITGRIYLVDLEDMSKQDLGKGIDPQFSHNGKEVIFVESGSPYLMWLFSLETGEKKKLVEGGENPIFSPDGKKVVFLEHGKNPSMWIVSLETGEKKKLIEDKGWGYQFSPDGKKIVFFRGQSWIDSNLWVIDADGNNLKQLTFIEFNKKDYRVDNPRWTENGKIIYEKWSFDTEVPMGFYYFYVVNPDGTGEQMLKKILWTAF
jgi:Tol biopolymer transport system component